MNDFPHPRTTVAWLVAMAVIVLLTATSTLASAPPPEAKQNAEKKDGDKGLPKNFLEFEPLIVNLTEPRSVARLAFLIEFKTPEDAADFNMAKARDAVIFLLSSKSGSDLWTGKDKEDLKWLIISRFNDFLGAKKVVRIHYTEFIVH